MLSSSYQGKQLLPESIMVQTGKTTMNIAYTFNGCATVSIICVLNVMK